MRRTPRFLLVAVLVLAGCRTAAPPAVAPGAEPVPLVLVSFDGFRPDYRARAATPGLDRMAAEGVHAERMTPVFPSLTFPNHYSLVTGLYPEHHGIVANTMVDPILGNFSLGNRDAVTDARWWGGEPLWATAQRQGARAATMFWPGSEAAIGGVRPADWKVYDGDMPYAARVDTALAWLARPEATRPRLVTLYFEGVDHVGHEDGPDAPEIGPAVMQADSALVRLQDGLRRLGRVANIVVVSDHGMAALSPDRVVYLDDAAPRYAAQTERTLWGATTMVYPKPGTLDSLETALSTLPHVQVYRRDRPAAAGGVPARFHFDEGARIAPLVLIADVGWTLSTRGNTRGPRGGTHGYDNTAPEMQAILFATGPAFKTGGVTVPSFRTVDVYDMLCAALGITPAPNDGDAAAGRALLR